MSHWLSFHLPDEFVDKYRSIRPNFGFGVLGELVFYRTYSRKKPDGTKESFVDVIRRCVEGSYSLQKDHIKHNGLGWNEKKGIASAKKMFDHMFHMRFLPPGRGLWMMGTEYAHTRTPMGLFNCAFVSTEDMDIEPSWPFHFLMDVSMVGVGCGFDTLGAKKNIPIYQPSDNHDLFVIPDSREGWVEATCMIIDSYLIEGRNKIELDYSEIRPFGEPIKGFGGVASGPAPLIELHEKIREVFDKELKKKNPVVTSRLIVDIQNMIGGCVVAGNVRRTAELAIGDPTDEEFLDLKNYEKNPDRQDYGRYSNNSIDAQVGMSYGDLARRSASNGEPGYIWLDNVRKFGRMADPANYKDANAKGCNPCFPEGTLLLTKTGMKPIEKIKAGKDEVWSAEGWTLVEKLFDNGVQPIYKYDTNAGSIVATETHKILQDGVKTPIGEAENIDILAGCTHEDMSVQNGLWSKLIMDGLVIGDGTRHGRDGSKIPLLCIGRKDRDYFTHDQVKQLIGESYSREDIFKIETDVDTDELVATHQRFIPDRYFQMDHQERCSFLKGLYSANGSVLNSGRSKRVTYKTASSTMAEQVQLMLSSVGIRSYKTRNKSNKVEFANGSYQCKESWDINITADRGVFFRQVGFLQSYKMQALESILPGVESDVRKKSYEINSSEYVGQSQVYDIQVANESHTYWCQGFNVSNCVEQSLESDEVCNLVENFIFNIKTEKEFKEVLKYSYLYAKSVTLVRTHIERTNRVQLRNRRLGISLSGLALDREAHGTAKIIDWMDQGYETIQYYDEVYSKWLAVPKSIKTTSIKPSGTVSLVAGATAGIHYPIGEYYVKNMRISKSSPYVRWAEKCGYKVEDEIKYRNAKDADGNDIFLKTYDVADWNLLQYVKETTQKNIKFNGDVHDDTVQVRFFIENILDIVLGSVKEVVVDYNGHEVHVSRETITAMEECPVMTFPKQETYTSEDTVVISIPVKMPVKIRSRHEVSVWEQMKFIEIAQKYWADNQVSSTVNFDADKAHELELVLEMFDRDLKNVSFLKNFSGDYPQMPEQLIDEETYNKMMADIKHISLDDFNEEEAIGVTGCTNDSCTI